MVDFLSTLRWKYFKKAKFPRDKTHYLNICKTAFRYRSVNKKSTIIMFDMIDMRNHIGIQSLFP